VAGDNLVSTLPKLTVTSQLGACGSGMMRGLYLVAMAELSVHDQVREQVGTVGGGGSGRF
jgi:hypothetical protein